MKHFLSLTDLSKNEISHILEIATQMRRVVLTSYKKGPQLSGITVAGVWDKPCTSSTAFGLASQYLSGSILPVFGVLDTLEHCQMLDSMGANTIVVSTPNDNVISTLANRCRCSVINGGSTTHDPIGVLADLMTINSKLDGLDNISVLAVGNRDTNKLADLEHCLNMFGSNLVWHLPKEDVATPRRGIVVDKIESAFSGADAVIDLGLTPYADAQNYYGTKGGIDADLMAKCRVNAPLLGSKYVVDKVAAKEYPHNALSSRQCCYVSVAMAILYLIQKG